jgi:hypothetical protein
MTTIAAEERRPYEADAGVDREIGKWNWGAFLWTLVWTIGHRLWWQSLLVVLLGWIPIVGLVLAIVFGVKGNRWAWEQGSYRGAQDFRTKERRWVMAWFVMVAVVAVIVLLVLALG